jgi:dipeptidyl aminopeptidase/acylaminoacyl peptidase
VAERVGTFRAVGFFSISDNGVLAYRTGGGAGDRVAWFDREGKFRGFLGPPGLYSAVALSPDAQHAAVARGEPQSTNTDIWLLDSARASRFTFDYARESNPVWSPDGSRLAFASARSGFDNIYQGDSRSPGSEQPMFKVDAQALPCDWSLDGRYILYTSLGAKTRADLWILPAGPAAAGAQRNPEPYLRTPFSESQGQFSPDGHWVAYSSDAPGTTQIYVQSFPAGNGTFQISTAGGVQPRWRKDGKELFYIAADGKLVAVDVKTGPKFEFGTPKALFDSRIRGGGNVSTSFRYDVAADGRFLIITTGDPTDTAVSAPITVVLNWTAGLKH